MAAIPVELAIVGIGAAGSVVIPAAVAGITAVVARGKMKPQTHKVFDILTLRPGDHISYKLATFDTRHAIIIESVQSEGQTKVVFVTGKKAEASINCEDIDLTSHVKNLYRYEYSQLICYAAQDVVSRAKSLTEEYNASTRHSVIHAHWKFFKDDEHFAIWCQTGMTFAAVFRGTFSTNYKYTLIKSIASLREGDHVCYKVGAVSYEHGIVVSVSADSQVISVVHFNGKPDECPKLTNIGVDTYISKKHLYRYDYDIGIGDDADGVVTRAKGEIGREARYVCYGRHEEFAVWCKTVAKCSPDDASTLTTARVVGHVNCLVQSKKMLKVGDHITYNSGKVYYYQHAIIVAIKDAKVDIVLLPGNVSEIDKLSIVRETVDMAEYMRKEQLYKYFYDVNEWIGTTLVVARALEHVGALVSQRPFKDPYHFAMWCKTGVYQVHGKAVDSELGLMQL